MRALFDLVCSKESGLPPTALVRVLGKRAPMADWRTIARPSVRRLELAPLLLGDKADISRAQSNREVTRFATDVP